MALLVLTFMEEMWIESIQFKQMFCQKLRQSSTLVTFCQKTSKGHGVCVSETDRYSPLTFIDILPISISVVPTLLVLSHVCIMGRFLFPYEIHAMKIGFRMVSKMLLVRGDASALSASSLSVKMSPPWHQQ